MSSVHPATVARVLADVEAHPGTRLPGVVGRLAISEISAGNAVRELREWGKIAPIGTLVPALVDPSALSGWRHGRSRGLAMLDWACDVGGTVDEYALVHGMSRSRAAACAGDLRARGLLAEGFTLWTARQVTAAQDRAWTALRALDRVVAA